tara:strand:- start:710 stop:1294 length:585 start_codon:yes stop_codon:yes gene_type:complete
MAKIIENSAYDPADNDKPRIPEGIYPAHVTSVNSTKFDDTGKSVYNLVFTVANEVKNITVPKLVSDGNGGFKQDGKRDGEFIVGKEVRFDKGMWLNPTPEKGKGWQNKNYVNWSMNLGVEFPETKDGKITLVEIEESDIIGKPCNVKVVYKPWEYNGNSGHALKVIDLFSWDEGEALSGEEIKLKNNKEDDLPF